MTNFTIITGIITIVGFFLQIRGMYPKYSRYYTPATIFSLGLTIGFTFSSIAGTAIFLPESISARNIFGFALFGGMGFLILLCYVGSIFFEDKARRAELSKLGSDVSMFFLFMLLVFMSVFFPGPAKNPLTYDEQLSLVAKALEHKDYDRALRLIEDEKRYLAKDDPRLAGLERMIADVQKIQIAVPIITTPQNP